MKKEIPMTKFEELLLNITHSHVYIQTHNFPDPDAIASGYGLQKLLAAKGIDSTLCYSGRIDRHNTAHMVSLTDIKIYNIDELSSLREDAEVILVDAQKGNSNIIDMTGNEIICIDHHPSDATSSKWEDEYRFCDIRPDVGACASIIASYFFENEIPLDMITATLLCYGIRIDTKGLSRGMSKLDLDMFYNLFTLCDQDIIHTLEHSSLEFGDLRVYSAAIESIQVFDTISFANAGCNCPDALIASVSDFMLDLKEVDFSIVYSFKNDGVKLSVRSEASRYDAGAITSRALSGIGGGGGHASMAGGFIPYSRLEPLDRADEEQISSIIHDRFLAVLSAPERFQRKDLQNSEK